MQPGTLYSLPSTYDAWRTASPPEPKVVGQCIECDGDIVQWDDCYDVPDGRIHRECFEPYAMKALDVRPVTAGVD